MKKFLMPAALVAALFSAPAFAFDDSDRAAVKGVMDKLIENLQNNNFEEVFSVMPPALLEKMAEQTGMEATAFKAVMVEQMTAALQQMEINEVSYDLDGMKTATSSADRDYAIVDTSTVMTVGGAKVKSTGPALAFEDQGNWYVLQVQGAPQVALMGELYPDLAGIEIPEMTITPVQ